MNEDKISIFLSTAFASFSLVDFKTILDIVLIVLSILNILIVLFIKLRRYLKDGKLDENEKKDLSNDFKELKENVDKLKEKGEEVNNGRKGRKQE